MVGSRDRRHGHAKSDGSNLCAIQEVGTEKANGNKSVEQVDEATSSNLSGAVLRAEGCRDSQRDHAASHTSTGDDEDGTTTETIDGEEGDKGRQEFPSQCTSSEGARIFSAHAQVGLEDDGGIDGNQIGSTTFTR